MKEKSVVDKFNLKEVISLLIIVSSVSVITGFAIANRFLKDKYSDVSLSQDSSLQTFIQNYNYVVDNYYGEIDEAKLLDGALKGMLESLGDPYTVYIDENEVNNFNIKLEGSYYGLGIEVYVNNDKKLEVASVFEKGPAYKVGIMPGDVIEMVNGTEITDSQLFSKYIQAQSNNDFDIKISRGKETHIFSVSKEIIDLDSVLEKVFEKEGKKIGYLGISIFANNTYLQVKDSLEWLDSEGIDSLIIDVRGNTGGHLTSVENILGLFLDQSHIIYNIQDERGITKVYSDGLNDKKYPIVILTNELSASASEILTVALKEEYGAKSVGKKTYGKGSAQELRTLPDGTQYKITTKKWLSPNGNSIDGVGVGVDLEVEFNSDYYSNPTDENDNQLQAALNLILG